MPSVQLPVCGHIFHAHCLKAILYAKWSGARIQFGFMSCPLCKTTRMDAPLSPTLDELLIPLTFLRNSVKSKALLRLQSEGHDRAPELITPGAAFYGTAPDEYALQRYAFYSCYKCHNPYFGGEASCAEEAPVSSDPKEFLCGSCSAAAVKSSGSGSGGGGIQNCSKHGTEYLEYKCRFCCKLAVYFCWGTTHMCLSCHADHAKITRMAKEELPKCAGVGKCPAGGKHPAAGEEHCLGCGVCASQLRKVMAAASASAAAAPVVATASSAPAKK